MIEARVAFMRQAPFLAYFYYDKIKEYPTYDMEMAATDGVRFFYNPEWFTNLRPPERCFVVAHEIYHVIWQHCQHCKIYKRDGHIDGVPFSSFLHNVAADYVINADLVNLKIGLINPEWLYDPLVKGTDSIVEIYKKLWKQQQAVPPNTPWVTHGRGSQPDKKAKEKGGGFDEIREPHVDPVTGNTDQISEVAFKEAIARAAQAAKAVGKMPGSFQRMVDEILEPQVSWKDKIRLTVLGHVGNRRENWATPNRRRIVMDPIVYLPGKRGAGADLVAVWIDCSGSVGNREYDAFFSEVGGIMQDVRPRRLLVGWCDAVVQRTEWVQTLDEVYGLMRENVPGRGGTSFKPPFEWMAKEGVVPETCVYLTDGMGPYPPKTTFPTIWVMSTDVKAPFGETVRIQVSGM
jgi:predicted metal-dependent peptidase